MKLINKIKALQNILFFLSSQVAKKHFLRSFIIVIVLNFIGLQNLKSQELNCQVQINSAQVQISDRTVFERLQSDVFDFMNNKRWTDYQFDSKERIEVNILITINSFDNVENFSGQIQIQSRRPVFNSSYNSVMLNYLDRDLSFKYLPGQPIEFIENTFTTNLASVLAFYAYLIIGLDFDSFAPMGGTPFFEKAQNIIASAQGSDNKGWKSSESQRNRFWMIENLLNPSYADVRTGIYQYHRLGLDKMHEDVTVGTTGITNALTNIQKVYRTRPGLFFISLFMTAKSDELVNIFSGAPMQERMRIVPILKNIDPVNSSKYNNILSAK